MSELDGGEFRKMAEEGRPADALMEARAVLTENRELAMTTAGEKLMDSLLAYCMALGIEDTALVATATLGTFMDAWRDGSLGRKIASLIDGAADAQEQGVNLWDES